VQLDQWFLTAGERGNDATRLDSRHPDGAGWTTGNLVEPLVHGATYFARLYETLRSLSAGDQVYFTDWRGDPDELLAGPGTEVAGVLAAAATRGVAVHGLIWRSHMDRLQLSKEENRHLGEQVEAAGGKVLLDQRIKLFGSHHQKLVVVRRTGSAPGRRDADVAFVGGIDLCHGRHDDAGHAGDPNSQPMAQVYGSRPPWHDVQLAVRGPAVGDLETVFRERWEDPAHPDVHNPLARLRDAVRHADVTPEPLPAQPPDPDPVGPHAVQVLRTYPRRRPGYPFAPAGERSVARGYIKAITRARRLLYLEDQYMWSLDVARLFARALSANPLLHLVIVVPRYPDQDGALALPPNLVGRWQAVHACERAGRGRVHVFDVENPEGVPVYVHAKACVIDDVWASVGSDNFNRRSWSHDSELSCAVLDDTFDGRQPLDPAGLGDQARRYARELRLTLWREHLGRAADGSEDTADTGDLLDPDGAVRAFEASARRLDDWYTGGRRGPRPPGRVRVHQPDRLPPWTRAWAGPVYRLFYDPDGRPWRLRLRHDW
jgi:phosphatidylserine/phosphatidylglycerophosphate/cardiolipin synthase-like enzyme